MKIGIFFGGQSREREISFAGGRTVYDNLNKELFEPVPIFVDSLGNFILLNWSFLYKGTIRDFYPPHHLVPNTPHLFQIYPESIRDLSPERQEEMIRAVGRKVLPEEFSSLIDFAFLALHGPYGEDGSLQGLLEWYQIPYSGSGIFPSAVGISKSIQQELLERLGFRRPKSLKLARQSWLKEENKEALFNHYKNELNLPLVIKAPNQGSSIGITVIAEDSADLFYTAVDKALFIHHLHKSTWDELSHDGKIQWIRTLTDIREGIGMPVRISGHTVYHPEELYQHLNHHFGQSEHTLLLESLQGEEEVLLESFIHGKEFSCIVIQDENGHPIALPPTEIVKGNNLFDYRSKYLPGMSRKVTPIDLPLDQIERIARECERLFTALHFNVYARLDGFVTHEGEIFLNDPNTTSGMLPSSFFFHQAAEIGMNPSQFLTYIIRTSLAERAKSGKISSGGQHLLHTLDERIHQLNTGVSEKIKVGVIMGGFSTERHISVESGRNVYEKLASSTKYEPIPLFLTGSEYEHQLFVIPVNIMLKDNADDIREKIFNNQNKHPFTAQVMERCQAITGKYVKHPIHQARQLSYEELGKMVDVVFIALHGRPGEDGTVQTELERLRIPYNGSEPESAQVTINKYETNVILRNNDIPVANSMIVFKQEWEHFYFDLMHKIEDQFHYPFIAKPSDDGCSSAVKKINNRDELTAYAKMTFGWDGIRDSESSRLLKLKYNEEFPQKNYFMVEDIIQRDGAHQFLEVTGGLLTHYDEQGHVQYEFFEPSETLASGDVLSLEEKFLAGEGQNITPARFSRDTGAQAHISGQVKNVLKRTAQALNVQGYARIDAFVKIFEDHSADTVIIEINSLPGMTPATCIFHQCALNGYKPYDFIDRILEFGMERNRRKHQL